MAEANIQQTQVPETQAKIEGQNTSNNVLIKAWERAAVLKTAAGGALITAGVFLTGNALGKLGADFFIGQVSSISLLAGMGTVGAALGVGGVALAKEPVQKAFEYFKSKPWEKNK